MAHNKNKVAWCLKKAEKELANSETHRGLLKKKPDAKKARQHIKKAEHNLKAIIAFKKIGFSDWSASAAFYAIYHSFLSILSKQGYESRNQECTFALINKFIDEKKILLDKELLRRVQGISPETAQDKASVIGLRETEQYGVSLSLETKQYERLLTLSRTILDKAKESVEE